MTNFQTNFINLIEILFTIYPTILIIFIPTFIIDSEVIEHQYFLHLLTPTPSPTPHRPPDGEMGRHR